MHLILLAPCKDSSHSTKECFLQGPFADNRCGEGILSVRKARMPLVRTQISKIAGSRHDKRFCMDTVCACVGYTNNNRCRKCDAKVLNKSRCTTPLYPVSTVCRPASFSTKQDGISTE
eukprot:1523930-Amphidinium_carterae.1